MPLSTTTIVTHVFQIPIAFEFRTVKIHWEESRANIIGCWRKQQDVVHLIAELRGAGGGRKIAVPLNRLSPEARKQCLAVIGRPRMDQLMREICSSLELQYFVHDGKTLRKHSPSADAWQLRHDFLGLKNDSKKIISFLNNWGRWVSLRNYVDQIEIANLQDSVRAATTDPVKWFSAFGFPTLIDSHSSGFPYFSMVTDACQVAIRMSMTIDLLQQVEFRNCARSDCDKPFPVRSQRKRVYCSQYCAHLESVRRGRTAQRSG